jgi:hypothetical protein
MSRVDCHVAPPEDAIRKNVEFEPEGERIRQELTQWMEKNGIVALYLDTADHTVEIHSVKLPPRLKSVLTSWGAISVVDTEEIESVRKTSTILDIHLIPAVPYEHADVCDQPSREDIRIDGDTAYMKQETLNKLKEYSSSYPTGVYPGKMWKRRFMTEKDAGWLLCWYGVSDRGPEYCSNEHRTVVIEP